MAHQSLRIAAAYHALGKADKDQLINSAHDALNDSVYTYSLGELATCREPRREDYERLFEAAMRELESPIPDPASAVITLLEFHVVRLVEGLATPEEVLYELYSIEQALGYNPPVKVSLAALEPLRPFVDQHYVIEELIAYRSDREEQSLPQPEDDGIGKWRADLMSMAEEWCRTWWKPVVDESWFSSTVVALLHGIIADRAFDLLPILADALQDSGCENEYLLDHLRKDGPHFRCCFIVDLLLDPGPRGTDP